MLHESLTVIASWSEEIRKQDVDVTLPTLVKMGSPSSFGNVSIKAKKDLLAWGANFPIPPHTYDRCRLLHKTSPGPR